MNFETPEKRTISEERIKKLKEGVENFIKESTPLELESIDAVILFGSTARGTAVESMV